jgi:hypothetical protein
MECVFQFASPRYASSATIIAGNPFRGCDEDAPGTCRHPIGMNSPQDEHIPVAAGAIGIVFTVAFGCSEEQHEMSTAATHFASDSNAGSSRGMRFPRIGGGC